MDDRLIIYHPEWNKYGRVAGPMRNSKIIETASHCIAFLSKNSRGTLDNIKKAKAKPIPIKIYKVD